MLLLCCMNVLRVAALSGLVRPSRVVLISSGSRFPSKRGAVGAHRFHRVFCIDRSLLVRRRRQGRDEGARFGLHFEGEYWPGGRQVRFTLSWLSSHWSVKCLMPRRLAVILLLLMSVFHLGKPASYALELLLVVCRVNQHIFENSNFPAD